MIEAIAVVQYNGAPRRTSISRKVHPSSSMSSMSLLQEEALIRNAAIDVELEGWSLSSPALYKRLLLDFLRQSESSVTVWMREPAEEAKVTSTSTTVAMSAEQRQAAIQLIDEWLADDSGYDQAVWPILQQSIEDNRLSYRRRFHE